MADKLAGVDPHLITAIKRILAAMDAFGYPIMVTDGVRTTAQQQALWRKGRTEPGAIVTYKDGVKDKSPHQVHEDGFGHAVDCCFVVNGKPSWDARLPWKVYGAMGEALGLTWGGNFTRLHDLPNLELP